MEVNGTIKNIKVEVEPAEAMKVIKEALGLDKESSEKSYCLLLPENEHNDTGKKAIYSVFDYSWYGSYHDDYHLVTTDPHKVELFEAYHLINEAIHAGENITK